MTFQAAESDLLHLRTMNLIMEGETRIEVGPSDVTPSKSVKNQQTLRKCLFMFAPLYQTLLYRFCKEIQLQNIAVHIRVICDFNLRQVCFPPLPLADLDWNICDLTETRSNIWSQPGETWGVPCPMSQSFEDPRIYEILSKKMQEIEWFSGRGEVYNIFFKEI